MRPVPGCENGDRHSGARPTSWKAGWSPVGLVVVLEELAEGRALGTFSERCEHWIEDPCGCVNFIQRRLEMHRLECTPRELEGLFVVHPARVYRIHEYAVVGEVLRARPSHHVQRRLCHVGVRMASGFVRPVELAL